MTKSSVEATGAQRKGNAICQWCDSPFKSKRKLKAHISGTHRDRLASNDDDDDDPETPSPETQDALLQLDRLRDYDDNLFFDFRDLFEDWTKRSFQNVDQKVLQRLRRRLHRRGVYTGKNHNSTGHKSIAQALNDLNQLPCPDESRWPDPPNWPDDELLAATLSTRSQAFKRQEKLKKRAKEKLNQKPTVKKPTVKKHTTKKTNRPTIVRPFATGGSITLPSQEKKETVQNDNHYISDGEDYSYEEVDSDSALDGDDVCDDCFDDWADDYHSDF